MAKSSKGTEAPVPPIDPEELGKSTAEETQIKPVTVRDIVAAMDSGFGESGTDAGRVHTYRLISAYLKQKASTLSGYDAYNIVVLFDDSTLIKTDADKVYNAVTKFQHDKPLLLILYSRGGSAASAYLIGKLCREYSNGKFVVSVPRYAKSAATLISCAANEIHMGSLSELGPIDPQINELPALGLKNSIEHIADLVKLHPASSDMFARYLQHSLELINLGYYERVAESAMQYAEKLLNTHATNLPRPTKEIAFDLVYKYKDHGFVIDKAEAEEIFGGDVVKMNSDEYELGNALYQSLSMLKSMADIFDHSFYFIGSLDSEPTFTKRR